VQHNVRNAYSIAEFCDAHSISRSTYYRLKRHGLAPAEMLVLGKPLISVEAATSWRAQMTHGTAVGQQPRAA
jgi:phage terminase small subunit